MGDWRPDVAENTQGIQTGAAQETTSGGTALKVIRVFPRRTSYTPKDDFVFIGHPPMIRPEADEVHISVTFTWDLPLANELLLAWSQYFDVVKIGGPALNSPVDASIPGLYVKPNVIFTSRGCNNKCPFCLVPIREGRFRPVIYSIPFNAPVINDNNLLQHEPTDLGRIMNQLKACKGILFSGGLEARLIDERVAYMLKQLSIKQLFLACDNEAALKPLERAMKLLDGLHGRIYCYALLAFNGDTIQAATKRLEAIFNLGAYPFAQLYQPPDKLINYSREWRSLQRTFCRPAATKAYMKQLAGVK